MHEIAPGVYHLAAARGSNVYALAVAGGVALIDSGMPGAAGRILAELAAWWSEDRARLQVIVLTHGHFDHTGGAAELAARSGAEVWAYDDEVCHVEGTAPVPYPSRLQRAGLRAAERVFGARSCVVTRALEDGEVLDALGGLQVLHTPGHTPGSICLYRPAGRVLFTGDLLVNSPRNGQPRALRFSVPQFSVDPAQALRSARRLLDLPIEVICCGHGEPVTRHAAQQLRDLLSDRG